MNVVGNIIQYDKHKRGKMEGVHSMFASIIHILLNLIARN